MTAENKYFRELTLNLQREGFTVGPEADSLLPVALDDQHLCIAPESGGIRYRKEDVAGEARTAALDKVIEIASVTAEYMKQMEAAPFLRASGLCEEFKLLADFNGSVLAGQETKYGVQMVTWDWTYNRTGVTQGHYYGPGGAGSYTAAKQDFSGSDDLPLLCDVCRHHHERWDGGGYPDGLSGKQIAPWVQMVGMADAFDALLHPRVYKPAFPRAQAVKMIVTGACGAFCPDMTACFEQNIRGIIPLVYFCKTE